jgi:hypothetical protein
VPHQLGTAGQPVVGDDAAAQQLTEIGAHEQGDCGVGIEVGTQSASRHLCIDERNQCVVIGIERFPYESRKAGFAVFQKCRKVFRTQLCP